MQLYFNIANYFGFGVHAWLMMDSYIIAVAIRNYRPIRTYNNYTYTYNNYTYVAIAYTITYMHACMTISFQCVYRKACMNLLAVQAYTSTQAAFLSTSYSDKSLDKHLLDLIVILPHYPTRKINLYAYNHIYHNPEGTVLSDEGSHQHHQTLLYANSRS